MTTAIEMAAPMVRRRVVRFDDLLSLEGGRVVPLSTPGGYTVGQILDAMGLDRGAWAVRIGERFVPPDRYDAVRPRPEVEVRIGPRPGDPTTAILAAITVASAVASAVLLARVLPGEDADDRRRRSVFDRNATDAVAGEPVPVVFGEVPRWGGKVVSSSPIDGVDGRSRVKLLICLGHGRLDMIGDRSDDFDDLDVTAGAFAGLYINDQPAERFEGVRVSGRMGHAAQLVIPGYGDTEAVQSVEQPLANTSGSERTDPSASGEAVTFTTTGGVDAVIVRVRFASGLYNGSDSGRPRKRRAAYRARWRDADTGGGSPGSWSAWKAADFRRAEQSDFFSALRIDGLSPGDGALDVQVERVTAEPGSLANVDAMRFDSVVEVQYAANDYRYEDDSGGYAMLAVEVTASEQLSGAQPRVSVAVRGVRVRIWDGVSDPESPAWDPDGFSANPAAICLAVCENDRWGLGAQVGLDGVDLASLFDWWAWCDELVDLSDGTEEGRARFRYDGGLTTDDEGWNVLARIADAGRCVPITGAGSVRFVPNRPQAAPVELFTTGSLVVDERGDSWEYEKEYTLGGRVRPNQLVARFANRFDDGETHTVEYPAAGEEWLATEPVVSELVTLEGVTDPEQAMAECKHRMQRIRFEGRRFSFPVSQPVVVCQPGDRVDVAEPFIGWGIAAGRALPASDASSLVVEGAVSLPGGPTYTAKVVQGDGSILTTTATGASDNGDGTFTIALSPDLAEAPDPYAEFTVGVDTLESKPIIVESVGVDDPEAMSWRIAGREYVPGVHDDLPGSVVSVPLYPPPTGEGTPPGPVVSLRAIIEEGRIRFAWRQAPIDAAHTAWFTLYRREVGEEFAADPVRIVDASQVVVDIIPGVLEEYAIVAVAPDGSQLSPNASDVLVVSAETPGGDDGGDVGLEPQLPEPDNVTLTSEGDGTQTLSWDAVSGAVGYRIELLDGLGSINPMFSGSNIRGYAWMTVASGVLEVTGIKQPSGHSHRFEVRSVNAAGRLSNERNGANSHGSTPPGESIEVTLSYSMTGLEATGGDTDEGLVNFAYNADTGNLEVIDPSAPAQWTGGREDLSVGDETHRLRFNVVCVQDPEDATLEQLAFLLPSAEADSWRASGEPGVDPVGDLVLWAAPVPDDSVVVELYAKFRVGGDWQPEFQRVSLLEEVVVSCSRVQLRVVVRRNRFPYALALRRVVCVSTA